MKPVTIHLPDEVASKLQVRAAIDNLRLEEGIEKLLCNMVRRFDIQKRWNLRRQQRRERERPVVIHRAVA